MNWWNRTARLLRDRGMRPADLARATGINSKLIYKYLDGRVATPRGETLKKIAVALGTTEQALLYGAEADTTVELRRVPLLTIGELGALGSGEDPNKCWDGVTAVAVPEDVSPKAFGVRLDDESNEPEFSAGEIVICEPEESVVPGRYAIAVRTDQKRAYFGRYQPGTASSGQFRIIPRNEFFPPVEVNQKTGFVVARATRHIRKI